MSRGDTPGLLTSLRHRDYRLLAGAFTISSIGSWAYNVALAVWLLDETGSAAWLSAATVVRFGPALLASAYGGVVADRFERVRLMTVLDSVLAAFMLLLAVEMLVGVHPVVVLATVVVPSVLACAYQPAAAAMTPETVPERDLGSANALRNTIDNLCVIVGPALGGLLLIVAEPWLAIVVNAATFVVSAAMVAAIRVRSRPTDVTEGGGAGVLSQVTVGVRSILESSSSTVLVAFCLVATFVFGTDTVLFVVLSEERLGTGAEGYGYLLAGLGVGGVAVAGLVTRLERRPRLGPVVVVGLAVYCLPTLALLVVDEPAVAFVLQAIRGAGTMAVDVVAISALQRSVPPERLGRVFGAFDGLCLAVILLGSALVPVGLQLVGLDALLWFLGLGIPLLGLLGWPALRRMDDENVARRAELAPRVALLQRSGLFTGASSGALDALAARSATVRVPAGEVVIAQGEPADDFYVAESGALSVEAAGPDGAPVALPDMGAGDGFGEIGLIEAIPRTATVRARTDVVLLRVPGDAFVETLTQEAPSPALLDGASVRLARTHPARSLSRAGLAGGDSPSDA